jgi:hypothetical protein
MSEPLDSIPKDAMFIAIQLRAKQEAEVLYDFVQCAADRDWLIAEVKRLRQVISPVFIVCNAYESGVGHGLQRDGAVNPYTPLTNEWEAYAIGYDEGAKRVARRD